MTSDYNLKDLRRLLNRDCDNTLQKLALGFCSSTQFVDDSINELKSIRTILSQNEWSDLLFYIKDELVKRHSDEEKGREKLTKVSQL